MEAIYHELAAGKDTSLSQVLDLWSKTYERRYEALRSEFTFLIRESDDLPEPKRPRSAIMDRAELSDFREQFDEVLRLRAALSTEVEALEQLRAELEDSESMSEVHIQLERATLENKRLQSAVRVAHEQVSDLFFSKRVLEAEMSALRSERDRQLAEANERVRLAERAVVAAATSRRRFTEPIATKSPVLTSRSGSHSGTGSLTESSSVPLLFGRNEDGTESIQRTPDSNSSESTDGGPTTVIATGSIVSKPQVTNFRQPLMGFKIAGHKRKDGNSYKNFATLTAMALEEFDSLDEDDVDDADSEDEVDLPQTTLEPTLSRPDRASLDESSEQIEYQSEAPEPTIHSSSVPAQLGSHSATSPSLHSKSPLVTEDVRQMPDIPAVDVIIRPQSDSERPKEFKSSVVLEAHDAACPISASCPESGPFSSPTSSSTPRKQLPTASETTPKAETLLLKDLSTDWQTAIVPATESDTVPRSDYLRLLDELDGVRQELELARRNQHVVGTAETGTSVRPCSVIATSTENARTTEFDPGLTEQLRDLANKVNEIPTTQRSDVEDGTVKRASLLPPPEPGTTRLFDWSVSPNQSSSSIEPPVVEKLAESLNDEDQTPARSSSPPATLCAGCLELEAKLIAGEVVASTEYEEVLRITNDRLNTSETRIKQLENELTQLANEKLSNPYLHNQSKYADIGVQCGDRPAILSQSVQTPTECVLESQSIQTASPQLTDTEVQTEKGEKNTPDSDEGLTLELRRYSKLSADAACICLALAQRLASLNHRGVPDGEQSMESSATSQVTSQKDFNQLLTALSGSPNGGEQEDAAMYRSGYKILAPALTQLNQEVERLACALDAESINKPSVHDFLSVSSTVIQNETDRDAEIAELRNRLSTALQLLAERLPVDTRKALADTTQLVETERLQLQAELERRMVLFEQNHTSSLTELETSRRALVEQLAASEATNVQLRDELAVLTQKFQAKERFLTEQTDERELEREEFRAEVTRLESQLQAAKAQLLTSKLVNGLSEPSDANCAWYTDSDDVEQTTPRRDKNQTTAGSKSRSQSAISKLARRSTWTPDDEEVDIDDALRDSPLAVRSKRIVSPMSVERQASWFAPNIASIMANSNNSSTMLDDLEPDSGGEELLPALRSAPHMSTVTIGTVNEKKVDHKAVHACVISGDVGSQTEDLSPAELELDHVSPYNFADACTQTKPDSIMNNVDATEGPATKTTTTRTVKHTLNGLTAAALFQRLSLTTEECTTVETGTPPSAELGLTMSTLWGETSPSRDVSDLLVLLKKREAELATLRAELSQLKEVGTDEWKKVMALIHGIKPSDQQALDDVHSESLKLRRSWSTPSITSPSIGSTAGDTGVEMSRGMTMIESIESAGVLDETDSDNSPVPRPFSGPGKLSVLSPRMETTPWSTKCPEGTVSGDEIHRSVEEVITSLNTTMVEAPVIVNVDEGGSWSAVSSLAPTPGSVVEPFGGQISLSEGPLTTATHCPKVECFDAECETTDLGLETISTSELEDLLGQKEASELVISTMRAEIDSLTKYQNELQADYNTVQSMLDDRQAEVDRHTRETLALQDRCMILERQVNERKNVILERDEDLFLITEEKEALENKVTKLQEENELFRSKLSNENKVTLDANVQTEVILPGTSSVGTMVTHSLLVSSLAVFNHTMEANSVEENADTIQDDASSLHSLNMAEAEDLLAQVDSEQAQRIAPIECPEWVTSTPEHRSLLMPIDRNKVALPQELQTLVKRLREESLRLFSLASACQPSAVIWSNPDQCQPIAEEGSTLLDSNPTESRVCESSPPEHRQNLTRAQTEPPATRAGLFSHLSIPPHQPTVLTDLVRANTALKSTLKSLAQTVASYENPDPDSSSTAPLSKDHVHELVRCTANALASDELVWLGMLDWSLCQTTGRVSYSLRSGVPYADKSAETKIHQFVWTAIGRLVEQLSAFMRQEDKYRECLVQAHLVEQQCLNSELQTALNRVENLSLEIDRLTERLASNKQALNRADGLNVQLANQVNNLKSELTSINEESKRERTAANQTEPGTVNTSTYIVKQQQQTILVLRAQLDTVSTEKSALDKELADLKRALKEYKDLVNVERKRVEIAEQKLADWQANWKEASDALGKAVHSVVPNTNGWALDSPVHSQKDNPNKSSGGPDRSLSNADDLFHAISRAATNLAAARHTANKAERRARELQATNQSLRLSLAEAELRLMPLLVTVTNRDPEDSVNPSSAVPTSNTSSAIATVSESFVQDRSQPTASSRFAELKGMCSRLLSLATAEDRNSPSPDSSDDDEDGPQALLMLNSSPNKTPVHRKRHSHLTPSLSHPIAERDSGPSSRGYKSTVPTSSVFPTYTSNPHQTARTPLTIAHVPSLDQISSSSRPTTSEDQTVSVERFRNLHVRYLRAESYRRALTFQKRYLVLLLGGFQFSEETVLASICRPDSTIAANTSPSSDGYPSPEFRTHPLRRFRVAVRAIAAIHRMYRMVYRWRRSGLHCPPSRGPNECVSTAVLQTPTDPTVPPHLVHYSQLPRSRTSVPNPRTPLRELDVGMLDGVQQVMHPQSTITSIPYPTTFPAGWPETHSHLLKPLSFSTAHIDGSQTVVGPPTISNYTITTSCPRTSSRSQTNNYDSPVKSAIPRSADWATASSTCMSQTIVRSGLPYSSSAIPFDIHPVIRSSPVLCDTHSNHHHARFDRTTNGTSTRLSSTTTTATHRSDLRTGPDRRRSAVQTPISSRNGVSYTSPRLQTSPRSSLPTRRVNSSSNRPCRQPPFK